MTTMQLGPADGSLTLHTGVEGRVAKAGHALTIALADWSATATFEGEHPSQVSLTTALASLEVVKGEGGLKPLSDKDKQTVKESALETLGAGRHPHVSFTSDTVTPTADGYAVTGQLSLAGTSRPVTVDILVTRAAGTATVEAVVPVVQTDFGVKPYTGLMGGLKVRDRVDVRVRATVATPD